jgi:hypothetical protein
MFSHSYCFFTGSGPDKVAEHSDLILRSFSASSIEEFLSTSHLPLLGGSPYRSSSPFATPRAYGRVPATASDDEVQRSGLATPTGPPMRRLLSTPPPPLYSPSLPLLASPRTAFSLSYEKWPHHAATSNNWSIALTLSLFVLRVPSSSQHQRSA